MGGVLTATDLSPASAPAVREAWRAARRRGTDLEVLHVVPRLVVADLADALGQSTAELEASTAEEARDALAAFLRQAIPEDASVVPTVVVGDPVTEIVNASRGRDLLVLGTYGHAGPGRGTGEIATSAVRKSPVSALLVEPSHGAVFKRVLACTDFSHTSESVVRDAVRIAGTGSEELHVLHVYYGPWHQLHWRAPTPEANPEFKRQYLATLRRKLEATTAHYDAALGPVAVRHALVDHPLHGDAIIEYATSIGADLLVMGTRGRSNLRERLLGSTAARVLRKVPCSMLALRPE